MNCPRCSQQLSLLNVTIGKCGVCKSCGATLERKTSQFDVFCIFVTPFIFAFLWANYDGITVTIVLTIYMFLAIPLSYRFADYKEIKSKHGAKNT